MAVHTGLFELGLLCDDEGLNLPVSVCGIDAVAVVDDYAVYLDEGVLSSVYGIDTPIVLFEDGGGV